MLLTLLFSLADGELYSGTSADFMGRDVAIFRTLGDHHPIRTEQHDSRWLNGKTNICSGNYGRLEKLNFSWSSVRLIHFPYATKQNVCFQSAQFFIHIYKMSGIE